MSRLDLAQVKIVAEIASDSATRRHESLVSLDATTAPAASLSIAPDARLGVDIRPEASAATGVLNFKLGASATGAGWERGDFQIKRLSLEIPLRLANRKRVAQAGEYDLVWTSRTAYQFHTPMNSTSRLLAEPDTNIWSFFRSEWTVGDTYTLSRQESASTAPQILHRGSGFPGWSALYDREGGLAVALTDATWPGPRAIELRSTGSGVAVVDLHPASAAPLRIHKQGAVNSLSTGIALAPFLGDPETTGRLIARATSARPVAATTPIASSRLTPVFGGVPLTRGSLLTADSVGLFNTSGQRLPLQSAPLAYWPDGSVKWLELVFPHTKVADSKATSRADTADALADFVVTQANGSSESFQLRKLPLASASAPSTGALSVTTADGSVRINTGRLRATFASGENWWTSLAIDGRPVFADARHPVAYLDMTSTNGGAEKSAFVADKIELEESGPVRAVVRLEGKTTGASPSRIVIRLEFYAGSPVIRGWHTFEVGRFDPRQTFITGLGIEFPLSAQASRAFVQLPAANADPLKLAGGLALRATHPDVSELIRPDANPVAIDPSSGALRLDAGEIKVAALLRDFRHMFPLEIAVRPATAGSVTLDLGFWPRDAAPMDLRRYSDRPHRAQGESVSDKNDWVERAFYPEDPVHGITRTHEFFLVPETAEPEPLPALAAALEDRPLIYSGEQTYLQTGVLAHDLSAPALAPVRENLLRVADFFQFHRERWRWMGKWEYGDIQHRMRTGYGRIIKPEALARILASKGKVRLSRDDVETDYFPLQDWASDNGRWGWSNTEGLANRYLSELYLRTGRRDLFFAVEALARQSRDVVMRHAGKWYGAGTRHGVQPWSDGDHQQRQIIVSEYRLHRLLTGDKRSRDVLLDHGYNVFATAINDRGQSGVTNSPQGHGAKLYGLLSLWEMTGDAAVGDMLSRYVPHFIVPEGIAISPQVRFPEVVSVAPAELPNHDSMFFHAFGGMHALVEYADLVSDRPLSDAIVRMAAHALDDPAISADMSGRLTSKNFYWLALGFAASHASDADRYRDFLRSWMAGEGSFSALQIVTRNREHWTGPTSYIHPQLVEALFTLNFLPAIAAPVGRLDSPDSSVQARLDKLESEGRPPSALRPSWQDEYDRPEFDAYLTRWLPWGSLAPSP